MSAPASAPSTVEAFPHEEPAPAVADAIAPAGYGGFWKRVAASLLDSLVVGIPMGIIFALAAGSVIASGEVGGMFYALYGLALVVSVGYYPGMESSGWQATLGKRALGMKVVDVNGSRLTFGRALGRYFGKFLSAVILYIGFFMIGFTEKKQGLHDMVAGCLVVNTK